MHIDGGVILAIIIGLLSLTAAFVLMYTYGKSQLQKNVADLQQKSGQANTEIQESLKTELGLRDLKIERLEETNRAQAAQIKALQEVVAQGTKVETLIATVSTLRTDVLARLPAQPLGGSK